ncbi:MAG TPA: MCP four helix bundle domain-containing protein, partial [Acidimicrobiales bacterium]
MDSFLSRFSMRTKIMAVVGVACALLIAVSGLTLTRMSAMNDRTQDLHDENLVAMDQVHSLRNALGDARLQDSFKSLLTAYQQDPSQLDEPIATAYARMDDLVATVVEDARGTVAEPQADELAELYEQFLASNAELQELNNENAGDFAATTIFYTETITPLLEGLDSNIEELLEVNRSAAAASAVAADDAYSTSLRTSVIAIAIALAAGLGLGWVVARALGRSTRRVIEVLEAVAAG